MFTSGPYSLKIIMTMEASTRRYVMETIPIDENSHLEWRCDSKRLELELSLSPGTAIYFQDIPHTPAEAIWAYPRCLLLPVLLR